MKDYDGVVGVLKSKGALLSPTDIGEKLGYSREEGSQKVYLVIKRLLKEGLIERVAKNSRNVKYRWKER